MLSWRQQSVEHRNRQQQQQQQKRRKKGKRVELGRRQSMMTEQLLTGGCGAVAIIAVDYAIVACGIADSSSSSMRVDGSTDHVSEVATAAICNLYGQQDSC